MPLTINTNVSPTNSVFSSGGPTNWVHTTWVDTPEEETPVPAQIAGAFFNDLNLTTLKERSESPYDEYVNNLWEKNKVNSFFTEEDTYILNYLNSLERGFFINGRSLIPVLTKIKPTKRDYIELYLSSRSKIDTVELGDSDLLPDSSEIAYMDRTILNFVFRGKNYAILRAGNIVLDETGIMNHINELGLNYLQCLFDGDKYYKTKEFDDFLNTRKINLAPKRNDRITMDLRRHVNEICDLFPGLSNGLSKEVKRKSKKAPF